MKIVKTELNRKTYTVYVTDTGLPVMEVEIGTPITDIIRVLGPIWNNEIQPRQVK